MSRRLIEDSGSFYSPVGSPAISINAGFSNGVDINGSGRQRRIDYSGSFHSPLPSPVSSILEEFGDAYEDDNDAAISGNGFYSPVPSPIQNGNKNGGVAEGAASLQESINRLLSRGGAVDERTPLFKGQAVKVYGRRWYVLVVFCMSNLVQGMAYGTYGPIAQSLKAVFGWSKGTLALLGMWSTLSYVVFAVPVSWILQKKGLRFTLVLSMVVSTLGLGLRCITTDPYAATWLNNISQILYGLAAVLPYSGVSLLSSVWFPPSQRTTATAVTTVSGYLGIGLSFIVGPLVVPEPMSSNDNSTNTFTDANTGNITNIPEQRNRIMEYFYSLASFSALTLVLVLVYFPSSPPSPPSISAGVKRLSHGQSLRSLMGSAQFQIILLAFSLGTGVYGGFLLILDIELKPLGVSQRTAGWMGFYTTIGGCALGFLVSRLSDYFARKIRLILIFMFVPTTALMVWFMMLAERFLHADIGNLYITVLVPGFFIYAAQPLFYELASEVAYPAGEDVATLVLTVVQNIVGAVFLGVLSIPGIGVSWMNYLLLAATAAVLPLLLLLKDDYRRTSVDDITVNVSAPGTQE